MMKADRRPTSAQITAHLGRKDTENEMLVLVATKDTQGRSESDYCHAVEGELVTPITVECCLPDRCGCGRGFPGLVSARATTTAIVVDRALVTPALLRAAVVDSLVGRGWPAPSGHDPVDGALDELVDEHVTAISRISRAFGELAVVRRDGPTFWADIHRSAA
jgi:hypothetical protein